MQGLGMKRTCLEHVGEKRVLAFPAQVLAFGASSPKSL